MFVNEIEQVPTKVMMIRILIIEVSQRKEFHREKKKEFYSELYADGYDENFMGDAKDRAWFNTLSEREREAELLKRHEQREIIKRRYEKQHFSSSSFRFVVFLFHRF